MDEMNLLDPNLIAIGALLCPILTEFLTKFEAGAKAKQWMASAIVTLVIAVSLTMHFIAGDIDINESGDVYTLLAFVVAQFGLVRAAVEGGHRGINMVETTTGHHLNSVALPSKGIGEAPRLRAA